MKRMTTLLLTLLLAALAFGQSLPPGVTLQAIDGETMTDPQTMSHSYYSLGGFTYATNNPSYPGWSWDDPAFFPIQCYYGLYGTAQSDFTTFKDIGLNVSNNVTTNSIYSWFATNGVQMIACGIGPGYTNGQPENPPGNYMVGIHIDETDPAPPIANVYNSTQDHRFWDLTGTWNNIVGGDIGGVPMSDILNQTYRTPNGTLRKIDVYSIDMYWFAGSTSLQYWGGCILSRPMEFGRPSATADQMARGSHYGNMIDVMRSYANNTNSWNGNGMIGTSGKTGRIPLSALIENGNGWVGGGRDITPPELNWAVWSSLIHGARTIDYFTQYHGFSKSIDPGQTISIYNQAKAINGLIKQLAPVLNSPFAVNYVTASPYGYNFPTPEGNWLNGGIETMAKYYNGQFYIFADTRASQTATNISATFTIKNTGATSVTVVNESRTIPLTNGGTTFTDTFAKASTVHIYQVTGSSGVRPEIVPVKSAPAARFSNPVRNLADIRLNQENGRVSLYDLSGKIMRQLVVKSGRLVVSPSDITLNNGMYFLGVEGSNVTQMIILVK